MAHARAHDDAIREQFRLQAVTWTDDRRFATAGLGWIVSQLAPAAGDQVLDVAAGAGHAGRGHRHPVTSPDWFPRPPGTSSPAALTSLWAIQRGLPRV
jgi:hypothetical protein